MLETIIFGANAEFTSKVQQMCSDLEGICVYRSMDRYPQAHEVIRLLNAFGPQLVFVDFSDEGEGLALDAVIRSTHPATTVLAVSRFPNHGPSVSTEFGSLAVLAIPCAKEEFRHAVDRALKSHAGEKAAPVFAFLPAKAGSGATTTALFVANLLSKRAHKKVLLLECDLHAGPISMLFNVHPTHSIVDALENSDRLTDASWKQLVSNLDGIDVLSSLGPQGVRRVTPWAYQRLMSFARSRYDVIISDLPEVVNDATEAVVRLSKSVFVVTAPSLPSLYLAVRRQRDLESRGVGLAKVKYILNRKLAGQSIESQAGDFIKAQELAAIPLDASLVDASEFRLNAAHADTIAECTKIAEFCCGMTLVSRRSGWANSISGWLRGSARTPELLSQAAVR
jgi:pilus assembly protein CpaE